MVLREHLARVVPLRPRPCGNLARAFTRGYQFCLSLDFPGEYRYRGSSFGVPVGRLSIIHPGEMHSARDPEDRRKAANYRLVNVGRDLLRRAAPGVAGRTTGEPFFSPIVLDGGLIGRFKKLHASFATRSLPTSPRSQAGNRAGCPPTT